MALTVVWIDDNEMLLRSIPFFRYDPARKYVDDGVLTGLVFKDRYGCPSVDIATLADFVQLKEGFSKRFGFGVITTG
ncbi:MAG: hypothetical protein WBG50_11740, partial [Desulfomonilaceae bacterium]